MARARAATVVRAGGPIQRVRDEGAGEGVEECLPAKVTMRGSSEGTVLPKATREEEEASLARARVVDGNLARVSIELAEAARRRRRDVRACAPEAERHRDRAARVRGGGKMARAVSDGNDVDGARDPS